MLEQRRGADELEGVIADTMRAHIKKLFGLSLLAATLAAGCHKETPPPPPAITPPAQPAPPPPAATTPSTPGALDAAPLPAPDLTANQQSKAALLTMMVQDYAAKTGRVPKDLNELVAAKVIAKIPQPPVGTKFVIDPQTRQVVIIKQ